MELKQEEWRPVKGFEGYYDVSSYGRVRSKRGNRILKPSHSGEYDHISLSVCGASKDFCIHKLVANAFVANPNKLDTINHIDENKRNNAADNLEWCTAQYNATYGNGALSRYTKVDQYSYDGEFIKQWESIKDAAEFYGIKYQGISRCCRGLRKHCYGFIWKYAGKTRKWEKTKTASSCMQM